MARTISKYVHIKLYCSDTYSRKVLKKYTNNVEIEESAGIKAYTHSDGELFCFDMDGDTLSNLKG